MSKILVCDDDKEIVEAIDIYLTQEGYTVRKAYDGEEALKILKEEEIDLLIIDVSGRHLRSGKRIIFPLSFYRQNQKMLIRY